MVDDVARALCAAAGRSIRTDPDQRSETCSCCAPLPGGGSGCVYWETFRGEARAAIAAAWRWHRVHRRWPGFCR
jgi:hypothetical protein